MDTDDNTSQESGRSEFKHPGDVSGSPRSRDRMSRSHNPGQLSNERLQAHSYDTSFSVPSNQGRLQAFAVSNSDSGQPGPFMRPNASRNREKQLEALRKFEEKLQETLANQNRGQPSANQSENKSRYYKSPKPKRKDPVAPMLLHVLDISEVTTSGVARWRPVVENTSLNAAEETVFYSLVQGRGELILFGGVQKDIQSMQRGMDPKPHVVRNNLYILSPKKHYF
ncbi:hypothetical protein FSP39_005360 [Pinctada imbricata]|uniref:Uncharacterized protein n=1 Tax=Pinctada imbricata TaxID=66713 RepID=A0AA89C374_PINIB|nr:hypothetical protein FSP39_005360 [Pinctada imbricata]